MSNQVKSMIKLSVWLSIFFALTFVSCKQQYNQDQPTNSQNVLQVNIHVEGMTCSVCQANVKHTIESLEGVQDVDVSLKDKMAFVTFDSTRVQVEDIKEAINKKGFVAGKDEIERK